MAGNGATYISVSVRAGEHLPDWHSAPMHTQAGPRVYECVECRIS